MSGARNLCLAEEKELDIVTICAGCANTLRETKHILGSDEKKRLFVHEILKQHGREFKGNMNIYQLPDILSRDEILDQLEQKLVRPLQGMKIATHYGCHYYRPAHVMQNGTANMEYPLPETMEIVLETLGAEIVPYNRQELCCGAAMSINAGLSDQALEITAEKHAWMNDAGVEALAVPCPTCFTQFDTGQVLMRRKNKDLRTFPVFHIAELTAFALGATPEQLNLKAHKIPHGLAAATV